ncbi:unnamed protein product [Mycena citricolor]|uniref:Uncharacterized protein n=1 Tax=Mycena citricolor TaxID=2018698 RepID=A0AAD2HE02_9AGAR|nr:unnamed protein product [Mycena citricolor]
MQSNLVSNIVATPSRTLSSLGRRLHQVHQPISTPATTSAAPLSSHVSPPIMSTLSIAPTSSFSLSQGSRSGSHIPAPASTAQTSSVASDSSRRHGAIIRIVLGSLLGGILLCVLSALLLIRWIKTRRRLQSLTKVEEGTGNIVTPYAGTASSAPQVKTKPRYENRNISVRRNFSRMAEEIQQLRGQVMRFELESWSRRPVGEEAGNAPPDYTTHAGEGIGCLETACPTTH